MPVPTPSSSYVEDWLSSGDGTSAKMASRGTKTGDASAADEGHTEPRRLSSESLANVGARPHPHATGLWGYSGYPYATPTSYDPRSQTAYGDTGAKDFWNTGYYWNTFPPMACTDIAPVPAKDSKGVIPSQNLTSNALNQLGSHPNTTNTYQQPYSNTSYPYRDPLPVSSTLVPEATLDCQERKRTYIVRESRKEDSPGHTVTEKLEQTPREEKMVDIIHDPSTGPRDVTVRMQMEIKEDYSEHLEKFSRLKRLGRTIEAQALFHDRIDHPRPDEVSYPLAQYAEMLLSAGDYKSFQKLASTLDAAKVTPDPSGEPHLDKILANFQLLKLLSQPDVPPETYINDCLKTIYESMQILGAESCFGSTEVCPIYTSIT